MIRPVTIHGGYKYQLNLKRGDIEYYRCLTFKTTNYKAKLIVRRIAIEKRESHSCVEIIRSETQEGMDNISRDRCNEWAREFIQKMAVKLKLYPHQIYEMMLLEANQQFASHVYKVPTKSTVLSTIRTTCDSMLLKDVYAVTMSPLCNLTSVCECAVATSLETFMVNGTKC
ncbi:hypothetical protein MXB_4887 [Myxobolus squamalis]|nr:hypothetical protein MXB_4887 [Myxobolus squamalis]